MAPQKRRRTVSDGFTEEQKALRLKICSLLNGLGYSPKSQKGALIIPGVFGTCDFTTRIDIIDDETAGFTAPYLPIPQIPLGNELGLREAEDWKMKILDRKLGTAAISPVNGLLLEVWATFRDISDTHDAKGLLFYQMYSIREYFGYWEDDASELVIKWGDCTDFSSNYPITRGPNYPFRLGR